MKRMTFHGPACLKPLKRMAVYVFMTAAVSCGRMPQAGECDSVADNPASIVTDSNGIYYWKSVFELGGFETAFLKTHGVTRLYVRMFDVAVDRDWNTGETDVFPIATTRFRSPIPEGVSVIPTVYITIDALRRSAGQEESLAAKIVERILAMVSFNDLGPVDTVQFDCDWTGSTRDSYFRLCIKARDILIEHDISLSGTVRLHQLTERSFPFERQVLMLYNLGGVTDYKTHNSILDFNELTKYVRARTDLPDMDFAYPTFGWGVLFRDKRFVALLHTTDFSDSDRFQVLDNGTYRVVSPVEMEGHELRIGDVIRLETSEIHEVMKTKELVDSLLGGHRHHNIIYHLDSLNLSRYSENEIRKIYSL